MRIGTRRRLTIGAVAVAMAIVAVGCGSSKDTSSGSTDGTSGAGGDINLVAYSTPQAAYEGIEAAFKKTPAGKGVKFNQSYGASGDQSRAVDGGQPADYVAFSLETDMTRLVKSGKVAADWNTNQYKGIVTNSVVVFVVRKGNPKNIQTWDDLTKPGVEVVTPNPFSSGAARWNIMAGYGAQIEQGKTPGRGRAVPAATCSRTSSVQDDSGRKALRHLHRRQGRRAALLRERGDLRPAERRGHRLRRARPDDPDREPGRRHHRQRQPDGRPRRCSTTSTRPRPRRSSPTTATARSCRASCPTTSSRRRRGLFTIDDLGGWPDVATKFFDTKTGIVAVIETGQRRRGCLQVTRPS